MMISDKKMIAVDSAPIAANPMLPAVFQRCERHKNHLSNMGMLAWYSEIERREKKGMKQKQCPKCKLWLFKDEY